MSSEDIKVSVVCAAYNHGRFIREALDGFIMQKTDFTYEVIVHDDASTDNTVSIIKEYEGRYPNLIKPIYETENQYSKQDGSLHRNIFNRVKGKYIAECEGDDYWTDPLKLQKQYDAMEKHPELDMCVHAADIIRDGRVSGHIVPKKENCVISTDEVIVGGGGYFATSSLFYRANLRESRPAFISFLEYDYTTQIWGSLRGGVLYLADNMSVYRTFISGSWSTVMGQNPKKLEEHRYNVIKMLEILDEDTSHKYSKAIQKEIMETRLIIFDRSHNYSELKHGVTKGYYKNLSLRRKLKINLKQLRYFMLGK